MGTFFIVSTLREGGKSSKKMDAFDRREMTMFLSGGCALGPEPSRSAIASSFRGTLPHHRHSKREYLLVVAAS
jgi:hypothetical protein